MMMVISTFAVEGFHRWPAASGLRAYLKEVHRHMFHFRVYVEVDHADRAIECHDLRDFCLDQFDNADIAVDFGTSSCEMIAESLCKQIVEHYGERTVGVEVMEDNENGAVYQAVAGKT